MASVAPSAELRLPAAGAATGRENAVLAVSEPLFTDYLVPFELTSVLLLAAIVGAIVLAKRRI